MSDTLRIYQSSFGTYYAQVRIGEAVVEFQFDHLPTQAEIDALVLAYMTPVETTIILEAENGTQV